jgi:glutathione peroxidase
MTTAYDFSFPRLDGSDDIVLGDLGAKAVLVVNTASECGFTPQYAGLQKLWERYRDRGLVVLGVPSNDFGAQEPGDARQIQIFCHETYAIDFPMTSKQTVIGGAAHPFYRWIVQETGEAAAPSWNFHKYLIGPAGEPVAVWPAKVDPLDDAVVGEIEALLGAA